MVQLKGNLMHTHRLLGEHARVNLQTGTGAGARNILHVTCVLNYAYTVIIVLDI